MSFLPKLSHSWSQTSTIPFGREKILALLQDASGLVRLSTIVDSMVEDEKERGLWHITERLPLIGGITTSYTARLDATPDGIQTQAWAGFGVKVESTWTVKELDDGIACEATEQGTVVAPFIVFPLVKRQLLAIHRELPERIINKLQEDTDSSP